MKVKTNIAQSGPKDQFCSAHEQFCNTPGSSRLGDDVASPCGVLERNDSELTLSANFARPDLAAPGIKSGAGSSPQRRRADLIAPAADHTGAACRGNGFRGWRVLGSCRCVPAHIIPVLRLGLSPVQRWGLFFGARRREPFDCGGPQPAPSGEVTWVCTRARSTKKRTKRQVVPANAGTTCRAGAPQSRRQYRAGACSHIARRTLNPPQNNRLPSNGIACGSIFMRESLITAALMRSRSSRDW
jgi:hypothetical protein